MGQKDLFRLKLYKKGQNEKLSKFKINEKELMESSGKNLREIIMSTDRNVSTSAPEFSHYFAW